MVMRCLHYICTIGFETVCCWLITPVQPNTCCASLRLFLLCFALHSTIIRPHAVRGKGLAGFSCGLSEQPPVCAPRPPVPSWDISMSLGCQRDDVFSFLAAFFNGFP